MYFRFHQTLLSAIRIRRRKKFLPERHMEYKGKTITPGMIMDMNQGDEAQFLNPSGQATDASSFIKQEIRLIAAGQGLSYETVSRDMSESNYSSARQGSIEDELTLAKRTVSSFWKLWMKSMRPL